jgi:hypothetical protein
MAVRICYWEVLINDLALDALDKAADVFLGIIVFCTEHEPM